MILSDREIRAGIARNAIKLEPLPSIEAWSSTALDLRLAGEITQWRKPKVGGVSVPISPSDPNYNFADLQMNFCDNSTIPATGFELKSGSFLLAWTIEKIQLPHQSRLAARVEGKSSLARLGVGVHVTAPTIHAGFGYKSGDDQYPGNPIQLEIWNTGPLDILLIRGMPICQLIFEWVDGTPDKGYDGRFAVQGPGGVDGR